jgi:hypothetical protein
MVGRRVVSDCDGSVLVIALDSNQEDSIGQKHQEPQGPALYVHDPQLLRLDQLRLSYRRPHPDSHQLCWTTPRHLLHLRFLL